MNNKFLFGFLTVVLVISPLVSAFGVTAPYWEDRPLELTPGQELDFALLLQNMVDDEPVILQAELTGGSEVASITDSSLDYVVPPNVKDVKVNLRVIIPEDAVIGTEYDVIVSFTQVSTDEGQMIQMTSGVEKLVPIVVVTESPVKEELPVSEPISPLFIGAIILLVLVLGYWFFKKK